MSEAWIERNIRKPPMRSIMQTLKTDIGKSENNKCFFVNKLKDAVNSIESNFLTFIQDFDELLVNFEYCDTIQNLRPKLEQAAALASRLIARRAHSFRVQPSFSYFRKMNIALCRLKELNIYDDIKDTQKAIGVAKTARKLDDKYYLPDRENFFYFLTKFQSFAKLLIRCVMCARESHRLFLELLHRSAFIEAISLFISVLAEVWSICREMCKNAVQFYNKFYPFYANNYDKSKSLPKRLNKWLGDEYKEYIDVTVENSQINSNEELFLFDGNETVESHGMIIEQKFQPKLLVSQSLPKTVKNNQFDEKSVQNQKTKMRMHKTQDLLEQRLVYEAKPQITEVIQKPMVSMKALPTTSDNYDLGSKISRTNVHEKNVVAKPIKHIDVEQIKTIKEIREFLSTEDELRQNDQEQNTRRIKNGDWEQFKSTTNQLLILSHHGLVMKKFRNEWKKLLFRRR